LHVLGEREPLLAGHRISYAPSASILLQDTAVPTTTDPGDRLPCVAFGYNGSGLHYAELEARHVATLAGGQAYTGVGAHSDALYREAAQCTTLHLACHGTFNPDAPLASGLLLADGKLDAMTILQELRLRADLVVLSACDTGQAVVLRGDELMGLARAILYAGARSVLVSLWPVDDLATALLMDAFYRARAILPPGAGSTAEALRQAQLALRSMTREEAMRARERLHAALATQDGASPDAVAGLCPLPSRPGAGREGSPAMPRTVGDPATAIVPVGEGQAIGCEALSESVEGESRPYANPYYWGAFALICRGIDEATDGEMLPQLHA
jgi:CHAT domain-containing protein